MRLAPRLRSRFQTSSLKSPPMAPVMTVAITAPKTNEVIQLPRKSNCQVTWKTNPIIAPNVTISPCAKLVRPVVP